LKEQLFTAGAPSGSGWAAGLGWLLLFNILIEVVTGVLLALDYAPSSKTAWPSVRFIQQEAPLGAFIRALHYWGANCMIVLLLLHLVRAFIWGAYKRPREFIWMTGVLLMFCTLGLTHTGALLPWDQNAYWGTKVRLGIIGNTPGVGDYLRELVQGGTQIGNRTLTRFFTLHAFVLPAMLVSLVMILRYLLRLHGLTPPWWKSATDLRAQEEPFWPGRAYNRAVVLLVFLVGLGVLSFLVPAPLEGQADPTQLYEARPEWYFLFLFQLRKYFEGPYELVATFVLPLIAFHALFFWPFFDRHPQRDPWRRPVAMTLFSLGALALVGLTILAIAKEGRTLVAAAPMTPKPAPPVAPIAPAQTWELAGLYSANCVACHGVDGTGKEVRAKMPSIADFTSMAWQLGHSDQTIAELIQTGKPPLMPAFRDKLGHEQMLALVIYIRAFSIRSTSPGFAKTVEPSTLPVATTLQAPPAPLPTALVAKQPEKQIKPTVQPAPTPDETLKKTRLAAAHLFRRSCVSCHGTDGRGNEMRPIMPIIPEFTNRTWQEGRTTQQLTVSILDGKGTLMPAFRGKVTEQQAKDLAQYVQAFVPGRVTAAEAPPSDFEQRLREVKGEWYELQKQMQELSKPPRKP